jgi:hypothetical protein
MALAASAQVPVTAPPITVRGIHPAVPRPFEVVNLRVSAELCKPASPGHYRVEQNQGGIRVTVDAGGQIHCPGLSSPERFANLEIRLGAFPVGTYAVDVVSARDVAPGVPIVTPQRHVFQVVTPPEALAFPSDVPFTDYTGMWWNPSESGWGVSVTHGASNQMFVALYHYDESGTPTWYVASGGKWTGPFYWSGTLYRTKGPPSGAIEGVAFDPNQVERTPVGVISLQLARDGSTFESPKFGTMRILYRIGTRLKESYLQRMEY